MTHEEIKRIADLPIEDTTILGYLKKLLSTLWEEAEGFSGKRPFGSGSWQFDVYGVLVKNNVVRGSLDEDGYIVKFDERAADKIIQEVIDNLIVKG